MAFTKLQPPPLQQGDTDSYVWRDWYRKLVIVLNEATQAITTFKWSDLDFTGSSLSNIDNRQHNLLQDVLGGNYHVSENTSVELTNTGSATYLPITDIPNTTCSGIYKRIGNICVVNITINVAGTIPVPVTKLLSVSLPFTGLFGAGTFQNNDTILGTGYVKNATVLCPAITLPIGTSTIFCTYTI